MEWSRAKSEIQKWGLLRYTYSIAMDRLKPWLTLCELQLREHVRRESPPELAENRKVCVASHADLLPTTDDPNSGIKKDWLKEAKERGEACAAVFENGRILSYVWRAFEPTMHEKDVWVDFDPQYSYSFKAFTRADCRVQRLQNVVNNAMDCHLLERGQTHCLIFVETHNLPSLVSTRKRGNRPVGYAGYLRAFGRVFCFRTPGAKRYGFRFFHVPHTANESRLSVIG